MAAPLRAGRVKRPARKLTAAERKHLSDALRGKHRTAAQKAAQSKRMKGVKRPHKGHKLTAKEKAALKRGAAAARARAKVAKKHRALTAKQQAALAKARTRKHTAAQKAAESARMKGKKRPPHRPRALRPPSSTQAGTHGQHPGNRPGRAAAPGGRTRRIYPSKFGVAHRRPRGHFVRPHTLRTVHSAYTRGRHHLNNWDSGGRSGRGRRRGRR